MNFLLKLFHSYLRNHDLIYDKIKNAKTSDWLSEGLTEEEIKEAISEAKTERDKERKGIIKGDVCTKRSDVFCASS